MVLAFKGSNKEGEFPQFLNASSVTSPKSSVASHSALAPIFWDNASKAVYPND